MALLNLWLYIWRPAGSNLFKGGSRDQFIEVLSGCCYVMYLAVLDDRTPCNLFRYIIALAAKQNRTDLLIQNLQQFLLKISIFLSLLKLAELKYNEIMNF